MEHMPGILHTDVLIVFALEIEAQGQFDDFNLIYCGVGKVNAAYRLTQRLAQWRQDRGTSPGLVLNLGSSGSTYFKAGSLVNCTSFIQRDFDVTALGCKPYVTPYENVPVPLANGLRFEAYPEGICGSGDTFVTDGAAGGWNVIDMEAYALAKVCFFENISFGCLKYITDGADGQAAGSWESGLADMARALRETVSSIVT
jgi:adenosylhomocysteine nucleosidase